MRTDTNHLAATALVAVLCANSAEWAWSVVYFGMASGSAVVVAVAATCLAAWWAATRAFAGSAIRCSALLVWIALWWIFKGTASLAAVRSTPAIGWSAAAVITAVAWFAASRLSPETVRRLSVSLCVASVVFVIATPIRAHLDALPDANVFRLRWLPADPAARNTVLVLFDELSPELAGPLVDEVRQRVTHVEARRIATVGKNTVNVVPAMLSAKSFESFVACGRATLCSDRWALDMRRLHAPRDTVDIVGFHLPYCDIDGLRSCSLLDWGHLDAVRLGKSLLCDLLEELGCEAAAAQAKAIVGHAIDVARHDEPRLPAADAAGWQAHLSARLEEVPFWRRGGVLYLHLPLPHPPAQPTSKDLAIDYRANLEQARLVTRDLVSRLISRFGSDFVLVITSDHGLRVPMHCGSTTYASPTCGTGLPTNSGTVPFILASPRALPTTDLGDNSGLLQ